MKLKKNILYYILINNITWQAIKYGGGDSGYPGGGICGEARRFSMHRPDILSYRINIFVMIIIT